MCQLTYSNLHGMYLNSLMIYTLGKIGSEKHDDGCGFICSTNEIWKTKLAAKNITNLGEIINKNVLDDRPIPFHVRMATYGIEVTKENAHPFAGKHFILMHNGTLLPVDGKEPDNKKQDSDSLLFLKTLDECKDINPNATFEELFNAAMANFAGKFAFIIRERETNLDYIVRGKTAELWISSVTVDKQKSGYVINTSKDTMKSAFMEFINIWDLFFPEIVEFSEPVLLEQESIFLAETDVVNKIGKTVEVTPIKKETKYSYSYPASPARGRDFSYLDDYDDNSDAKVIVAKAAKIYDFLHEHNMGLVDLQLMVMVSGGISILELTEEDLDMFIEYMIPKLSANKKIKIEVNNLLNGLYFPAEVYDKYKLEYPWTVNDGNAVINALKDYYKKE